MSKMREPTKAEWRRFRRACADLKVLTDRGFRIYLANNSMCLMRGDSHDDNGVALRENMYGVVNVPGASGGDW